MIINMQNYPRCFWHSDCKGSERSGIMKLVRHEESFSVFRCLNCGKQGRYPVGAVGCIKTEELPELEAVELTDIKRQPS